MFGVSTSLGTDESPRDSYDEFVPSHLPEPGPFLSGHSVLSGRSHGAFHRLTRDLFERRTVYDMTFGYNLARLNLDGRHPDAGYRYAEEHGDSNTLRAEFTPTTPFCPQSRTLTVGSFRAWNGLTEWHEYDLVRVRVHPMHQNAETINEELERVETKFRQLGTLPDATESFGETGSTVR